MNSNGIKIVLTVFVLMATSVPLLAANNISVQGNPLNVGQIFSQQKTTNAIVLLLQAHIFRQQGNIPKALEKYRQILEKWPPNSKWGRIACLKIARCLLCQKPADFSGAADILEKIKTINGDLAWQRELQIWTLVHNLHQSAGRRLENKASVVEFEIPEDLVDWRVPYELLKDFKLALDSLCNRFILSEKAELGADFLQELLWHVKNQWLQQTVLRELVSMQLSAKKVDNALISARAYWIMSTQQPEFLLEAIDRIIECLAELGASDQQIEQYRLFQTYGDQEQDNSSNNPATRNIMILFVNNESSNTELIPQNIINSQKSVIHKIRMLLLNGDIARAVSLLEHLIKTDNPDSKQYSQAMELVRMALALHDGHIHAIDRYDRYLYQKSLSVKDDDGQAQSLIDPLDELTKNLNK